MQFINYLILRLNVISWLSHESRLFIGQLAWGFRHVDRLLYCVIKLWAHMCLRLYWVFDA